METLDNDLATYDAAVAAQPTLDTAVTTAQQGLTNALAAQAAGQAAIAGAAGQVVDDLTAGGPAYTAPDPTTGVEQLVELSNSLSGFTRTPIRPSSSEPGGIVPPTPPSPPASS